MLLTKTQTKQCDLKNFSTISEEQKENDKISFQICETHRQSINQKIQEALITYCVCVFLFHVYPGKKTENIMLQCMKKYGIFPTDKCKFNLSIVQVFEMALDTKHYIQFVVLFVHTVFSSLNHVQTARESPHLNIDFRSLGNGLNSYIRICIYARLYHPYQL